MSSKKNEQRAGSDIPKKDENSHHDLRVSDSRPKTSHGRGKTTSTKPSRPKSADTRLARGSLKGEKPAEESIKVLERDTKKGALKNEKAEWERENVDLQRRLEEEKEKVKETENKIKDIKEKNKNELERMSKLLKEREESLSKAEEDKKMLEKNYNQLQQDMERELNQNTEWDKYCKSLTKKHTKEKKQLSDTIESLKAEKDNLLTRLSSVAADRLTHENVNIADLSDADRPTKLQELYSELYDNEWTDAFQELTEHQKIPDKDAIMILLDLLTSSFQKCREITWGRYERIMNVTSSISIDQRNSLSSAKKNTAKQKVEMDNPNVNEASKDEVSNEIEKNSPIDNNLDTMQEETASSGIGEKKGNLVMNEKGCILDATDENVDPSDEKNGKKENVDSGDPNVSEASKDKYENQKGKFQNGAYENVDSGDPNVNGASKDKSENQNGKRLKCKIDLSFDLVHEIKGIWRKTCVEMKGISSEQIYSVIETCLDMPVSVLPMTSKYLTRCIDLCWKMGVQEKPLHLDSISELDACAGKRFDKDKFRAYTQSGKIVAFVVWPSLYLHEGGPVLLKGIAQGCTSDEKRESKMHS